MTASSVGPKENMTLAAGRPISDSLERSKMKNELAASLSQKPFVNEPGGREMVDRRKKSSGTRLRSS